VGDGTNEVADLPFSNALMPELQLTHGEDIQDIIFINNDGYNESKKISQLTFYGSEDDCPVLLSNIARGISENDAVNKK
jgi:hypothetical protein